MKTSFNALIALLALVACTSAMLYSRDTLKETRTKLWTELDAQVGRCHTLNLTDAVCRQGFVDIFNTYCSPNVTIYYKEIAGDTLFVGADAAAAIYMNIINGLGLCGEHHIFSDDVFIEQPPVDWWGVTSVNMTTSGITKSLNCHLYRTEEFLDFKTHTFTINKQKGLWEITAFNLQVGAHYPYNTSDFATWNMRR